jgi:hypothetical protein
MSISGIGEIFGKFNLFDIKLTFDIVGDVTS